MLEVESGIQRHVLEVVHVLEVASAKPMVTLLVICARVISNSVGGL